MVGNDGCHPLKDRNHGINIEARRSDHRVGCLRSQIVLLSSGWIVVRVTSYSQQKNE